MEVEGGFSARCVNVYAGWAHTPHHWTPAPGMEGIHCEGFQVPLPTTLPDLGDAMRHAADQRDF